MEHETGTAPAATVCCVWVYKLSTTHAPTSPILRRGGAGNAGLTVELWRYSSSSRTAIPGECATGGRVERTKREFLAYIVQREKLLLMQGLVLSRARERSFGSKCMH